MGNAEKIQYLYIDEWHDCYISAYKQRGFVATLDLSKIKFDYAYTKFWGANDKAQLIAWTDGSRKPLTNVFLSLNAFNGKHRRASALTQIRNIGIDLDCYKLGMTPNEATEQLQQFIFAGKVPNPNLLIRSGNGLQLIYGLAGGLPPTREMKWLATYITNELTTILQPLGADFAANTLERVFRLPYTYNVKPGKPKKLVTVETWNREEFTIDRLLEYCTPLEASKSRTSRSKSKGERIPFDLTKTQGMTLRTLNTGRLNDLLRLIELRNGAIELRNVFTYDYAFTLALMTANESAVLYATQQINELFDDPQSVKEVQRTALNGFKDARKFWTKFVKNDYSVKGLPRDLVKPKQTRTIIKQHAITEDEQRELDVLIAPGVKLERKTETRREKGVKPRSEYEESRKAVSNERIEQLRKLLADNPGISQRKAASLLGCSAMTISRMMKEL